MKNNNNLYHLLIFILSLGGVFLTFDMHFVDTIVGSCGGRCECSFNTFAPLGISNIYWGMLYYFSLTVLGLIPIIPKLNNYSKPLTFMRNILIIFGFAYSVILVLYQNFNFECFCRLCLYSAAICLLLILVLIKSNFSTAYEKTTKRLLYLIITIIGTGLIIFDYSSKSRTSLAAYKNIEISESVVIGNPNAKITITEWMDFQ